MKAEPSSGGAAGSPDVMIGNLGMLLVHEPNSLPVRSSAIASLQEIATNKPYTTETIRSINALATGLYSGSSLVRHKSVRALGVCKFPTASSILRAVVKDSAENDYLRTNALRGLGYVRGNGEETQIMLELLTIRYNNDESQVMRETAEVVAASLSLSMKSTGDVPDHRAETNNIAVPFIDVPEHDPIQYFTSILRDESESLLARCQAMANLRDLANHTRTDTPNGYSAPYITLMVIKSLTSAFIQFQTSSVVLQCQVITILGQMHHKMIQTFLLMQLKSTWGDEVVRATAAETILMHLCEGGVNLQVVDSLRQFEHDSNDMVRDCVRFAIELARDDGKQSGVR